MKGIDNILKPLYDLWHKVMDKLSVVNNRVVVDGQEIVVKFVVENVKALTDAQCEALQCGDVVAKKTGNQYHCYKVTYKEDKQGLVITYMDASLIEGQSYDYANGHWVYNSEDLTPLGGGGGTKLYKHTLTLEGVSSIKFIIYNFSPNQITSMSGLPSHIRSINTIKALYVSVGQYGASDTNNHIFSVSDYTGSGSHLYLTVLSTKMTSSASTLTVVDLTSYVGYAISDTVTEL